MGSDSIGKQVSQTSVCAHLSAVMESIKQRKHEKKGEKNKKLRKKKYLPNIKATMSMENIMEINISPKTLKFKIK